MGTQAEAIAIEHWRSAWKYMEFAMRDEEQAIQWPGLKLMASPDQLGRRRYTETKIHRERDIMDRAALRETYRKANEYRRTPFLERPYFGSPGAQAQAENNAASRKVSAGLPASPSPFHRRSRYAEVRHQ